MFTDLIVFTRVRTSGCTIHIFSVLQKAKVLQDFELDIEMAQHYPSLGNATVFVINNLINIEIGRLGFYFRNSLLLSVLGFQWVVHPFQREGLRRNELLVPCLTSLEH